MTTTRIQRSIAAPAQQVFEAIAHIDEYGRAIPHIIKVELLSEQRTGVGTRFKETRLMGKREVTTALEVTEYDAPNRVRLVSESGGTLWDSIFTLSADGDDTNLEMVMEATAQSFFASVINLLIKGAVAKSIAQDMDSVKQFCESQQQ